METVRVNKRLLIGVVAVGAVSLLALAFALGRASCSGSTAPQPSESENPRRPASPVSDPRAPDRQAQLPSWPNPPSASITDPSAGPPASGPASAPSAGDRGGAADDPDRAAVAAYFNAVDRIQPGTVSGDAESAAREMAAALAKGDTSELDRMIRETEAARESLVAITPPATCAAHYRESLGSLDDAIEMLRALKMAMESSDPAAQLTVVAGRAGALRSRSEALQKEELALRQRYGLPR